MSLDLNSADDSWTRYKIDKPSFLKRYEVFFDSIGRNPTNPKVDGDTLRWLPLMFIVVSRDKDNAYPARDHRSVCTT